MDFNVLSSSPTTGPRHEVLFHGSRKEYSHNDAVLDLKLRKATKHMAILTHMPSHTKFNRVVHMLFIIRESKSTNSPI